MENKKIEEIEKRITMLENQLQAQLFSQITAQSNSDFIDYMYQCIVLYLHEMNKSEKRKISEITKERIENKNDNYNIKPILLAGFEGSVFFTEVIIKFICDVC